MGALHGVRLLPRAADLHGHQPRTQPPELSPVHARMEHPNRTTGMGVVGIYTNETYFVLSNFSRFLLSWQFALHTHFHVWIADLLRQFIAENKE